MRVTILDYTGYIRDTLVGINQGNALLINPNVKNQLFLNHETETKEMTTNYICKMLGIKDFSNESLLITIYSHNHSTDYIQYFNMIKPNIVISNSDITVTTNIANVSIRDKNNNEIAKSLQDEIDHLVYKSKRNNCCLLLFVLSILAPIMLIFTSILLIIISMIY